MLSRLWHRVLVWLGLRKRLEWTTDYVAEFVPIYPRGSVLSDAERQRRKQSRKARVFNLRRCR